MNDIIYKIIEENAHHKLGFMAHSKSDSYIAMCYAGLRAEFDKFTVIKIGEELGYTASGVSKLIGRWNGFRTAGDRTINNIAIAYQRFCKRNARGKKSMAKPKDASKSMQVKHETPSEDAEDDLSALTAKKTVKGYKFRLINLELSEDDILRERNAIREAIKFMDSYGRGVLPRRGGEYYAPGTMPVTDGYEKGEWLTQEAAALYCGCSAEILSKAASQGMVVRRSYLRNTHRNYYEYNIKSLDEFIRK